MNYWPIRHRDGTLDGDPFRSTIRNPKPYAIHSGEFVAFIEGKAGYVLISHLTKA